MQSGTYGNGNLLCLDPHKAFRIFHSINHVLFSRSIIEYLINYVNILCLIYKSKFLRLNLKLSILFRKYEQLSYIKSAFYTPRLQK